MDNNNQISLGQYLHQLMNEQGLAKRDIVKRLEYKIEQKAYLLLDKALKDQWISPEQLKKIAKAFSLSVSDLNPYMERTLAIIKEKAEKELEEIKSREREAFKPFLVAIGAQSPPQPIFAASFVYHKLFIRLDPSFPELPPIIQLDTISEKIKEHMELNKGGLPAFGRFTHYVYRRKYDESFEDILLFDIHGELIRNPAPDIKRYHGAPSGGKGNRVLNTLFGRGR